MIDRKIPILVVVFPTRQTTAVVISLLFLSRTPAKTWTATESE